MVVSNKKYKAEIFNLATSNAYSALEIAQTVYKILGKEFVFQTGNADNFWDKYTDLFNQNYNLNRLRVKQEVFKHCLGNGQKVANEFDYKAKTSLKDGLSQIIEYQKNYKG